MAFRRPPSNVESMVSLRVDNLPYRAVGEVNSKGTNNFIIDICTSGFKASLWQIWRGWRYLSSNRERDWKISRICVREILRPKRRGGSFMGRLRDSLKSETDFFRKRLLTVDRLCQPGNKLGKCWGVEDGVSFEICHHPSGTSAIYYEHSTDIVHRWPRHPLTSRIAASDFLSSWVEIWWLSSDLSTWERERICMILLL